MENKRSPLTLSAHEILAAILFGMLALLGLGIALWLLYQPYAETPDFYERRIDLFLTFAPPFALMVVLADEPPDTK